MRDIGALIAGVQALDVQNALGASSTSNGDTFSGRAIDRTALNRRFLACKVLIPFNAAAQAASSAKTLTMTISMQDSTSGSTWDSYSTDKSVTQTFSSAANTTSTAFRGVGQAGFDLTRARQFVRVQVVPTLDASSSGTASAVSLAGLLAMALGEGEPATATS